MGRTGRSGNNFRSFTFEEGRNGICFHWDSMAIANRSGTDYSPFLGCKNGAKGTQMVVRNNATDTVFCGLTNEK